MSAQDIAIILGAAAAFIVTVGGFFVKVIMDLRQMKDTQLKISEKVDGLTERTIAESTKAAKAEGKLEGKAEGEQAVAAITDLAKTIAVKTPPDPKIGNPQ